VTCTSPINIALVKYWGKLDSKNIIPANDSFSITLNKKELSSTTTIRLTPPSSDADVSMITLELNGEAAEITDRIKNVVDSIRQQAPASLREHAVKIISHNNFKTAAGMASSASGLSCLAFALFRVYGFTVVDGQAGEM